MQTMTEPAAEAAPADAAPASPEAPPGPAHGKLAPLALAALGVVYGDIGTSPLYAVKECFTLPHGVAPDPEHVLGVMSLVIWSLMLVVTVKYLSFIMRADNRGEGGILTLLSLILPPGRERQRGGKAVLVLLALFGASLLYGEGLITPAISVLSAVEGFEVATTKFRPFVLPVTIGILIALFLVQRRGTAKVGAIFGPATLVWFVSIAIAGAPWIARDTRVFRAIDPRHAIGFFAHASHPLHAFLVLGSVVLCVTGSEALYADMGHFGKRPIRAAWFAVVLPSLLLNYLGQGAMLLHQCSDPHSAACRTAVANPFFALISGPFVIPMVIIATIATVVASQALISGAYSLTQSAVQLSFWPRVRIVHTSGEAHGQIYVPEINTALMIACVALVLAFKHSTNLAAAYGIAVTGTMTITSILFYSVARNRWKWSAWSAGGLVTVFLSVDLAFFAANLAKIKQGGWFPLAVATGLFALMTTWSRGRDALKASVIKSTLPLDMFMDDLANTKPVRVPGTAVFMTHNVGGAPPVLLHHFKHNKVLHEQVVLLTVKTVSKPTVPPEQRVAVEDLGQGFWQVIAEYGFMQTPNVMEIFRRCRTLGLQCKENDMSYYLGRETLLTTGDSGMARWRKGLFAFMSRNARSATAFFGIPPNRVVELGTQIEL